MFSMKGGYDGMLTESDIEFMRASQEEIYVLRERPVDLIYFKETHDPITGELIGRQEVSREVIAVVTEISSGTDRSMESGVIYEQGDIKIDVKLDHVADIEKRIVRASYDGENYEIISSDRKGIGIRNRVEIIGRVIA